MIQRLEETSAEKHAESVDPKREGGSGQDPGQGVNHGRSLENRRQHGGHQGELKAGGGKGPGFPQVRTAACHQEKRQHQGTATANRGCMEWTAFMGP